MCVPPNAPPRESVSTTSLRRTSIKTLLIKKIKGDFSDESPKTSF